MGGLFFGVLRSGTKAEVSAFLNGVDPSDYAVVVHEPPSPEVPQRNYGPAMLAAPGYLRELIAQEFPEAAWEHAALISRCESGWNPGAVNRAGEDSHGLFQINIGPGANTDLAALGDLHDAATNVKAARIVWERQGWRAWYNCANATGVGATGPGIP